MTAFENMRFFFNCFSFLAKISKVAHKGRDGDHHHHWQLLCIFACRPKSSKINSLNCNVALQLAICLRNKRSTAKVNRSLLFRSPQRSTRFHRRHSTFRLNFACRLVKSFWNFPFWPQWHDNDCPPTIAPSSMQQHSPQNHIVGFRWNISSLNRAPLCRCTMPRLVWRHRLKRSTEKYDIGN